METLVPPPSHHARILTHFFGSRDAAAHYLIRSLQGPWPTSVDREHLRSVLRAVVRQWVALCRASQWQPYVRHFDKNGSLLVAFCGSVTVFHLTARDPDHLHDMAEYAAEYASVTWPTGPSYHFIRFFDGAKMTSRLEVRE